MNRTRQKIKDVVKTLKGHIPVKFDESLSLYEYLNSVDPVLVAKWKTIVSNTEIIRQNLIQNLDNHNYNSHVTHFTNNTSDFNKISHQIKQEIDALFVKKPDQEIATLSFQLLLLTDKSLLSKLYPDVLKFINEHKWADAAEQSQIAFRTNSITTFQGTLFARHITDKYSTTFIEECVKLHAPNIVEISQQNSKVKSSRKLLVAKQSASQVLSEGEQRAISLADFLTEVQLNPNNRGVIFDDPVTSLDHERRAIIAKRLVDISEKKQVIIFTHDISFFAKLTSFAELNQSISLTKTSIRKFGNSIGLINPEIPWIAQKISDRVKYLRNDLVRVKKIESEGDEDQYNQQVKGWYGMLREAWERCVEERLFKGAIERFSGEVHTRPLSRIEINPELIAMIDEGMTQSSNWVHDQAMGLNPPIPNTLKAEADLNLLVSFAERCKAN